MVLNKSEIKKQIERLMAFKRKLSFHHPGDDDPTGEFYSVKEKRRSINEYLKALRNQLKA